LIDVGTGDRSAGMQRIVEKELLDELPADDVRAVRSRRDLRRINGLMGHTRIFARLWKRAGVPANVESVVELGAGDGTFCLAVVRRLSRWRRIRRVVLVDRRPCVGLEARTGFERLGCRLEVFQADVFQWLKDAPDASVVIANLFLHHFSEREIEIIFRSLAGRAPFVLAVEPRRTSFSLACSRLLGLIGCNAVTRHDAVASVRAGFNRKELSTLWPPDSGWQIEERPVGLFSHALVARHAARNGGAADSMR